MAGWRISGNDWVVDSSRVIDLRVRRVMLFPKTDDETRFLEWLESRQGVFAKVVSNPQKASDLDGYAARDYCISVGDMAPPTIVVSFADHGGVGFGIPSYSLRKYEFIFGMEPGHHSVEAIISTCDAILSGKARVTWPVFLQESSRLEIEPKYYDAICAHERLFHVVPTRRLRFFMRQLQLPITKY